MKSMAAKQNAKIGYIILSIVFIILLIRSVFGFCWSDESFYLATVHRLYLGDRLLIDEWHPTQFYTVLLLPLYRMYLLFVGNTDGIYLAARIFSNIMIFCVALYLYRILCQKYSMVSVSVCACLYMLYSRSNVDGLTYHNLTLSFALIGIVTLFDIFVCEGRRQELKLFFGGISLGCMVVCNPYQTVVYLLISLGVVIFGRVSKIGFRKIVILWTGTLFAALCYILWIIGRQGVWDTIKALPNLFQDVEHGGGSVWGRFVSWFPNQISIYGQVIKITISLWVLAIARRIVKKEKISNVVRIFLLLLDVVALGYAIMLDVNICGGGYIALMLYGSVLFLLIDHISRDMIEMLLFFYVPGIAISMVQHVASNTYIEAIPVGLVIASIASIIWGEILFREMAAASEKQLYKIMSGGLIYAAAFASVCMVGLLRIWCVYRDDRLMNLTKLIEDGPAKGLYTSDIHYEQYMAVFRTMQELEGGGQRERRLFCSKLAPWVYLCTDMRCGSYTTWRVALDDERLWQYYEEQDYFPDYVLVLDEEYGSYVTDYFTGLEYCDDENANSYQGYFAGILTDDSIYERVRVECGILYKKNMN